MFDGEAMEEPKSNRINNTQNPQEKKKRGSNPNMLGNQWQPEKRKTFDAARNFPRD